MGSLQQGSPRLQRGQMRRAQDPFPKGSWVQIPPSASLTVNDQMDIKISAHNRATA